MSDLGDDYYELDKENYRLVGQRSGNIYTFGDKLKVSVKETNLARRSMDLILVGGVTGKVRRPSVSVQERKTVSREDVGRTGGKRGSRTRRR